MPKFVSFMPKLCFGLKIEVIINYFFLKFGFKRLKKIALKQGIVECST